MRPQLERLDRLICRSEGIDPGALSFAFRPLWQLDGPSQAALALSKAQATQVYAGLGLWPAEVTAKLVQAQLIADGIYPNAAAVFAEGGTVSVGDAAAADAPWAGAASLNYLHEKRNRIGEWTEGDDDPDGADSDDDDDTGNDPLNFVSWRERKKKRLKAKRHRELTRKREREERRRREYALEPSAPAEPESPSSETLSGSSKPSKAEIEKEASQKPLEPHETLPDSERDGFELPAGVTSQEANELQLKGSPIGISFEVQGNNTTAVGKSYSDAVNTYRGARQALPARELGGSEPDGILDFLAPSERIGVEAKFVEDWSESLYNPDLRRVFPHNEVQNTVDQALKYAKDYPAGVEWYTNSLDFVRIYSRKFKESGIKNFTFTIIPAARIKP